MVSQNVILIANFFCKTRSLIPPWISEQPRPQYKKKKNKKEKKKGIEPFLIHDRPQSFLKIKIFSGVFLYSWKGTFLLSFVFAVFFSETFRHFCLISVFSMQVCWGGKKSPDLGIKKKGGGGGYPCILKIKHKKKKKKLKALWF